MMKANLFLGIDFGTSGARAIALTSNRQIQFQTSQPFSQTVHTADLWQQTLFHLLYQIPSELRFRIRAIAINGTSSTVLLCDPAGNPIGDPLMYNDDRGAVVLDRVRAIAPPNHTVVSATSSLAKLLWFATHCPWIADTNTLRSSNFLHKDAHPSIHFLHQSDYLSFLLHGRLGITDYHNALKLGYDVGELRYPDWLQQLEVPFQLPQVVVPGEAIAPITSAIAAEFHLPPDCTVCAGTTDSIAAFLASGACNPGEAVTSLGSTLVLKLLSTRRVDDARYGIYSHRLGDLWLVGGASNTGGAILKHYFSDDELRELSQQISPDRESPLHYYPLLKPGERFPINDSALLPQLQPQPDSRVEFLHGLLESIARIEARGYQLLQELGATPLTQVYTAGGGAKNQAWGKVRSRHLWVPVTASTQTEAAYGTALLAMAQAVAG